jgi:hypothetical protein
LIGHVTYMVKRKMRCWKNLITVPKQQQKIDKKGFTKSIEIK